MPTTKTPAELVVEYLEGAFFKDDLPDDFDPDNGGTSESDPEINGRVKMTTTHEEVELLLESSGNWVAGQLGFQEYDDITPKGSVVDEIQVLYAAARLHCKKMKDSDQKKEVSYPTNCLKEHELYQSCLDMLEELKPEDGKTLINENLIGWV